jgi:(3S)-malyl-CoA thioesterase
MDMSSILPPRSALYLPASNPRAIEKARGTDADLIMLDLEDAVKAGMKDEARAAAVEAAKEGFPGKLCAIRINGKGSAAHTADIIAVRGSACDLVICAKVETADEAADIAAKTGKLLLAMIETPKGVFAAREIAKVEEVAGLIAGVNDLANDLHIPPGSGRAGLALSLQMILLAARETGVWALDGVYNALDDAAGLEAECEEGRRFGFDGKTLIHPNQIEAANRIWSPNEAQVEEANALIAAASGGAERFRDRMIETMHVEMAKRLLARSSGN